MNTYVGNRALQIPSIIGVGSMAHKGIISTALLSQHMFDFCIIDSGASAYIQGI